MNALVPLLLALLLGGTACSQSQQRSEVAPAQRPNLYACDGCEVAEERSPDGLPWQITLPPADEPGERFVLSGTVVQPDGETPAEGVVLYLHQTNAEGLYRSTRSVSGGGRSDGMIEGWLKTGADGRYEVSTIRPAPYPDAELPAHIHIYVKEPGRRPYYIDDVTFEGDPFVTPAYREAQELRSGSGILMPSRGADGVWRGQRDIVLER